MGIPRSLTQPPGKVEDISIRTFSNHFYNKTNYRGHVEIMKFLLDALNRKGNPEDTSLLLNKETKKGLTPLSLSAKSNRLEEVKFLCEQKSCDLLCENKDKQTAFSQATKLGHAEIMESLLDAIRERYGEEKEREVINKKDGFGRTPLMHAESTLTGLNAVKFLVKIEACDLMALDDEHNSALARGAMSNIPAEMLQILIDAIRAKHGKEELARIACLPSKWTLNTPLHSVVSRASGTSRQKRVEAILKCGGNAITSRNLENETPFFKAISQTDLDIIKLLLGNLSLSSFYFLARLFILFRWVRFARGRQRKELNYRQSRKPWHLGGVEISNRCDSNETWR